jgi:hypothetical protein
MGSGLAGAVRRRRACARARSQSPAPLTPRPAVACPIPPFARHPAGSPTWVSARAPKPPARRSCRRRRRRRRLGGCWGRALPLICCNGLVRLVRAPQPLTRLTLPLPPKTPYPRPPAGAANAGIPLSIIVKEYGWATYFNTLIGACFLALLLLAPMVNLRSYVQRREQRRLRKGL